MSETVSLSVVPTVGAAVAEHVSSSAAPFVDIGDGTLIQLLMVDLKQNLWITRNRMQAGTRVVPHYHTGPVYAFTLKGRWFYEEYPETVNEAGSFLFEPAGSVHTLKVAEDQVEETVVWFMIYGTNLNIDAAGNVLSVADAHNVLAGYRLLCESQGLEATAVIVHGES